jgi:signal recognition particle receptor subunit beta
MTSRLSDTLATPVDGQLATKPLKIVIAGGFAVGKTTFVDSISEITPLTTEAPMTSAALGIDDAALVASKTTTTVAMDFGRITLGGAMMLYLFGTPGQDRFWFMWDELSKGAVGAVVLVDTRRLPDCFPAVDYFEQKALPYAIALNAFNGTLAHSPDAVRKALAVDASVPVLSTDARDRASTKQTLIELVRHAIARKRQLGG